MDNFAQKQTNIPQCRKKTQRHAKQPKMDCLDDGKEAKLLKISELVFYRVRKSGSKMKESSKKIWNMFFSASNRWPKKISRRSVSFEA